MQHAIGPSTDEGKMYAIIAHIGAVVVGIFTGGFLGFVAPLVIMFMAKDKDPWAAEQAKESLNFQLMILIFSIVTFVATIILSILTFGLAIFIIAPIALIVGLAALVLIIMATIAVSKGQSYRYPINLRLVS